jgi:hypothetical protein
MRAAMRPDPLRALEKLRNVHHAESGRQKGHSAAGPGTHAPSLRGRSRALARDPLLPARLSRRCAHARPREPDVAALRASGGPAQIRDALENTGIAGTAIRFPFFWPTAVWLARNWPRQLTLDRLDRAADQAIGRLFGVRSGFAALDRIRPRTLADAVYFIQLVERMPAARSRTKRSTTRSSPCSSFAQARHAEPDDGLVYGGRAALAAHAARARAT